MACSAKRSWKAVIKGSENTYYTVLDSPLHTTQYSRHTTFASWSIFGMEALSIVSVCHINAFIARDGVPIYDECWMDTVLPLLLHLNGTRSQNCSIRMLAWRRIG